MKLGSVYISSRGLKKADKYDITSYTPPEGWSFENEFCCIRDYTVSQMSQQELLNSLGIHEIRKL